MIKYRFDEKTISRLLQVDFSQINEKIISEYLDELYKPICGDDDECLRCFPVK